MLPSAVNAMIQRELGAVRRTIEAYPDEASVWKDLPGLPNSGGTLVLHIAGNLQHFFGTVLGGSAYKRDRDAEFSRRDVPRADLVREIQAAESAVALGARAVTAEMLMREYPLKIADRTVATGDVLIHLAVHLAYHLGQLDYHRRMVTGDKTSVGAVAASELPVR